MMTDKCPGAPAKLWGEQAGKFALWSQTHIFSWKKTIIRIISCIIPNISIVCPGFSSLKHRPTSGIVTCCTRTVFFVWTWFYWFILVHTSMYSYVRNFRYIHCMYWVCTKRKLCISNTNTGIYSVLEYHRLHVTHT